MIDSRFSYLERPTLSPGACAVCKSHDPVIDYRVNVPVLGRLYICVGCLKGGLSNVPLSEEQWKARNYEEEIANLQELVEEYRGVVARAVGILSGIVGADVPSDTNGETDSPTALENIEPAGKKSKPASLKDPDGISSDPVDDLDIQL